MFTNVYIITRYFKTTFNRIRRLWLRFSDGKVEGSFGQIFPIHKAQDPFTEQLARAAVLKQNFPVAVIKLDKIYAVT